MSRTLKRPMFRRGGSTNDGIMSGLVDREQKSTGDLIGRTRELTPGFESLLEEFTPKTRLPLGAVGAALVQGTPIRDALASGYADFVKRDDARERAVRTGAAKLGIGQAQAEAIAKIKDRRKTGYAAQTPEEQFKVKSKIYSESKIPAIRDNATNIANFEVRHRDKPYVQLGFVYSDKTRKFEPNFNAIPSGTITFNPVDNFAYKRTKDGKFIRLDPITLIPIENVDGTE